MNILTITGSTRDGRQTPKVVRFFKNGFGEHGQVTVDNVDLKKRPLPFLTERLKYLKNPDPNILLLSNKIKNSDFLLIISPEYNGAPPGVLKNALDHFNSEYENKPVGIVTVSAGAHGGKRCFEVLKTFFNRVGAFVMENHFQVNTVYESFDDAGNDLNNGYTEKRNQYISKILSLF